MKRIIFSLMLLFLPVMCFGHMVGSSGDIRRYVTEAEKSQFPFNTVVHIKGPISNGTGTFVSDDIILTCRHVVESVNQYGKVDYYTTDGKKHTGAVLLPKNDSPYADYAMVLDVNAFTGDVLELSDTSVMDKNLMIIGYDGLKVLNNDELNIIKNVYKNYLQKNGALSAATIDQTISDIELELIRGYSCTESRKENCVRCSSKNLLSCIFDDGENMKIREGCGVVDIKDKIYTDCPGAPGVSGSALIADDRLTDIGILCWAEKSDIGQTKDASTLATKPEIYYEEVDEIIRDANLF